MVTSMECCWVESLCAMQYHNGIDEIICLFFVETTLTSKLKKPKLLGKTFLIKGANSQTTNCQQTWKLINTCTCKSSIFTRFTGHRTQEHGTLQRWAHPIPIETNHDIASKSTDYECAKSCANRSMSAIKIDIVLDGSMNFIIWWLSMEMSANTLIMSTWCPWICEMLSSPSFCRAISA